MILALMILALIFAFQYVRRDYPRRGLVRPAWPHFLKGKPAKREGLVFRLVLELEFDVLRQLGKVRRRNECAELLPRHELFRGGPVE